MSDRAQAEQRAVEELTALVRHLADELAAFRRRALTAEARLKEMETVDGGAASIELARRVSELERQNSGLETRLATAADHAKQMLERVRFLRQQAQGSQR